MARRYCRAIVEMIVEDSDQVGSTVDYLQDVLSAAMDNYEDSRLDPGEVHVEVHLYDEVIVNVNGYAVPWPYDSVPKPKMKTEA